MLFKSGDKRKDIDCPGNQIKVYNSTKVETTDGYITAANVTLNNTLVLYDDSNLENENHKIINIVKDGSYIIFYI